MEVSILTAACTLVPSHFFNTTSARDILGEVVALKEGDAVKWVDVPQYDAVLVYAVENERVEAFPELYYILQALPSCRD